MRVIFQAVIWVTRGGSWRRFHGTGLDGKGKAPAVGRAHLVGLIEVSRQPPRYRLLQLRAVPMGGT